MSYPTGAFMKTTIPSLAVAALVGGLAANMVGPLSAQTHAPRAERWENHCIRHDWDDESLDDLNGLLRGSGRNGWQLIGSAPTPNNERVLMCFTRRLPGH